MRTVPFLLNAVLLTALALAAPAIAQVKAFAGTDARKNTRVFYYTQDDKGFHPKAQVSIGYGVPSWKKEYDGEGFDKQTRGRRWRLGASHWTTLDTNVDLVIGEATVKAGSYYVVLERTQDDKINLILLDPAAIRKAKLDAVQANLTKHGTKFPMQWTKVEKAAMKMSIELKPGKRKPENVELEVRFGPHKLTLNLAAKV